MPRDILIETTDGAPVRLRPLTLNDEGALRVAISKLSNRSRYLRFFNGAATLPEHVVHRLADVDGVNHVAWVAIDESQDDKPIIGAVHAQRGSEAESFGEFSIALLDDWHARGVSRVLIALLAAESRQAGMEMLKADVLWENKKGRALMAAIGARSASSDGTTIQFRMVLEDVLEKLGAKVTPPLEAVLTAIDGDGFFETAA